MSHQVSIEHMADEAVRELLTVEPPDREPVLAAGLEAVSEYLLDTYPEMTRAQRARVTAQLRRRVEDKLAAADAQQPQRRTVH